MTHTRETLFSNRGIEEIAMKIMGIDDPTVAPRYTEMLDVAKEYFRALEGLDVAQLSSHQRGVSEARLKNSPAHTWTILLIAFLELQRVKKMEE